MPIGVICDSLAHLIGGFIGAIVGKKISESFKEELNHVIGLWAMTLGIALIPKISSFCPVAISLIVAYIIGWSLDINGKVNNAVLKITEKVFKSKKIDVSSLSVLLVLACFGGSGIVGAMTESLTGDSSIIISRAIIGVITAMMFGVSLGPVTCLVCIPDLFFLMIYFFSAKLVMPLMNDYVYGNFSAMGGIITLMSGLKIFKLTKSKPMNSVLSIFFVIPLSLVFQSI